MKLILCLVWTAYSLVAEAEVLPDFKVSILKDPRNTQWRLVLTPPAKHHFNVKAPMEAKVAAKSIIFEKQKVSERTIVFESGRKELSENDVLQVSAFLCDQALTYCARKQLTLALVPNADAQVMISAPLEVPSGDSKAEESLTVTKHQSKRKKDKDGFWDNEPTLALEEAAHTGKLLLIDFYGIWCPPCNLYQETVFPTQAFHRATQKMVLLKMDADCEESWKLKSQFKVGGYPTLIIAKAEKLALKESHPKEVHLKEIDRVVGFFPSAELVLKLKTALTLPEVTLSERLLIAKGNYLELLQSQLKLNDEQGDSTEALRLAEEGVRLDPENAYFKIMKIKMLANEKDAKLSTLFSDQSTIKFFDQIVEQRKSQSVDVLLNAQDLWVTNSGFFDSKRIQGALAILDEFSARINSKTLKIDGFELSITDIDSLKVEAAEALKDPVQAKKFREKAIASYRQLMSFYHDPDSRALNLELAALLRQDGQIEEAKAIYERFIKRFPDEFTFYLAASKLYLEIKDFAKAENLAHHAVERSYGDNQIRSIEQWVNVLIAEGNKAKAKEIGQSFLAKAKDPKGFQVRTGRYLERLQKILMENH